MPRGFRAAALHNGFILGNNPGNHGVMVPAGFLMLDAGAETANGAAVLEAAEQGKADEKLDELMAIIEKMEKG